MIQQYLMRFKGGDRTVERWATVLETLHWKLRMATEIRRLLATMNRKGLIDNSQYNKYLNSQALDVELKINDQLAQIGLNLPTEEAAIQQRKRANDEARRNVYDGEIHITYGEEGGE